MKLIEHFVGGKVIPGSSDKKGKVYNPATGEQESEVRLASKSDLDQAVEVAKKAFETWSLKPPLQRARVMFKFKELIEKNSDELTKLIVSEHGKVYDDAQGSLTRGLEVVEFACGIPHLLNPVITDMSDATNGLRWCVQQMEKRYRIMSELKVRDIKAYNKLVLENEQSGNKLVVTSHKGDDVIYHEKLPYIVVVL